VLNADVPESVRDYVGSWNWHWQPTKRLKNAWTFLLWPVVTRCDPLWPVSCLCSPHWILRCIELDAVPAAVPVGRRASLSHRTGSTWSNRSTPNGADTELISKLHQWSLHAISIYFLWLKSMIWCIFGTQEIALLAIGCLGTDEMHIRTLAQRISAGSRLTLCTYEEEPWPEIVCLCLFFILWIDLNSIVTSREKLQISHGWMWSQS